MIDPAGENLPFRYSYQDASGHPLFDYYSGDNLMSRRLVVALAQAGVDNLQLFESLLVNQDTGEVRTDYVTVNVVGLVSCASLSDSETSPIGSSHYFHELVIDESKTHGLRLFRLAESFVDILVHESVAHTIMNGPFIGLTFMPVRSSP
jgi:hypothetical protein